MPDTDRLADAIHKSGRILREGARFVGPSACDGAPPVSDRLGDELIQAHLSTTMPSSEGLHKVIQG